MTAAKSCMGHAEPAAGTVGLLHVSTGLFFSIMTSISSCIICAIQHLILGRKDSYVRFLIAISIQTKFISIQSCMCGSQAAEMLTNVSSSALIGLRTLNPHISSTIRATGGAGPYMPRQDAQAVTPTTLQNGYKHVMGVSSFAFQVPITSLID